jgi:pantoate kinase
MYRHVVIHIPLSQLYVCIMAMSLMLTKKVLKSKIVIRIERTGKSENKTRR